MEGHQRSKEPVVSGVGTTAISLQVSSRRTFRRLARISLSTPYVAGFMAAHVLLGLAVQQSESISALHVALIFGIGIWWAATGQLTRVAYVGMYIAGAEVFWRMSDAPVPWEFGKYAVIFLFGITLVASGRIRGPLLPLVYFLLLVPGIVMTLAAVDVMTARDLISFNMSGPLALLAAAWFYSHIQFTSRELLHLILAAIGPILSTVTIAISTTISATALTFAGDSNFVTSGGFGPNQVSTTLGLGALLCLLYIVVMKKKVLQKGLLGVLCGVFLVQSALTFSRSGLALAFGAGFVTSLFLLPNRRARLVIGSIYGIVVVLTIFVLIPRLDDFTGGAFSDRFTDETTTGRAEIAREDIQLWTDNPLFGIGAGMASETRITIEGARIAAHTELTRMVAEHGMLGWIALVAIVVACSVNILRATSVPGRAIVAGLCTWGALFMLVSAFRLAALAVIVGLTFANFRLNDAWRLWVHTVER